MSRSAQHEWVARLHVAFDLFEAGVDLYRQNLRRADPAATAEEIERRVGAWLRERPGAEWGDAWGRRVAWPRERPGQ
jgi:hypothetical protein